MIPLCEGVTLVGSGALGFDLTHPADCHIYLVTGRGARVLVDAGAGLDPDALVANIAGAGVTPEEVTHLFLTHAHADHAGGAAALRQRIPGLRVVASGPVADILARGDAERAGVACGKAAGVYPAEYSYRACPADERADDERRFALGDVTLTALHTPGHSVGHTCYLAEIAGRRVLFSGDHLFTGGRIALQNTWDCSLQEHVASLRRLDGLAVDRLMPGHGGVSLHGAQRHVDLALKSLDAGLLPPSIV